MADKKDGLGKTDKDGFTPVNRRGNSKPKQTAPDKKPAAPGGAGTPKGANKSKQKPTLEPLKMRYIQLQGLHRLPIQPVIHVYDETESFSYLAVRQRKLLEPGLANAAQPEGSPLSFAALGERYLEAEYGLQTPKVPGGVGRIFITSLYTGCQISGLFYMGPTIKVEDGEEGFNYYKDMTKIKAYWTSRARQQYGYHVFCSQTGSVMMSALRIYPETHYNKDWSKLASLNALYPTVRFQRQAVMTRGSSGGNKSCWPEDLGPDTANPDPNGPHLKQEYMGFYWLTLGLIYDGSPNGPTVDTYNTGDRYYVRHGVYRDKREFGCVSEMTDPVMDTKLKDLATPAAGRRWAVYVCAGAKLALLDRYSRSDAPGKHNRTLVQQGGVVAGRGELYFGAPISEYSFVHHSHKYTPDTVMDAQHWFTGLLPAMKAKLNKITNPVVFIAPVESEYGSIAWCLDIVHPKLNQERRCVLGIPEGGWFVAIEDWDAGIAEIKARHKYERLYESNVRMDASVVFNQMPEHKFEAPDEVLAKKIVGINADQRLITTDVVAAYSRFNAVRPEGTVERTPLPVIYRCRQMTSWTVRKLIKKATKTKKPEYLDYRPPMPADWPLVEYIKGNVKITRMSTALACLGNGFKNCVEIFPPIENNRLYTVPDTGAVSSLTTTQYKRQGLAEYNVYAHNKRDVVNCDTLYGGIHGYMGIDGWVYDWDVPGGVLGKCRTDSYEPVIRPKVSDQPLEPITRPATPDADVPDDWETHDYDQSKPNQSAQ